MSGADEHERATPNGRRLPPFFDPRESARFADEVLRASRAKGALIGKIAVWGYLPDPDKQQNTKDLDIAVSRASLRKIRDWLIERGIRPLELPIGGVKVRDPDRNVNVDFIERSQNGDLSALFEEAVEAAIQARLTLAIDDRLVLPLVPAEHLVAMKIGTGEAKDERDAIQLIREVRLDVVEIRRLAARHLGVAGANRFEAILRDIGHPAAKRDYTTS